MQGRLHALARPPASSSQQLGGLQDLLQHASAGAQDEVPPLFTTRWSSVDDFDWLKAQQSPHWSVLPEAERAQTFDFFLPAAAPPAAAAPAAATAIATAVDPAEAAGELSVTVLFFAAAREEARLCHSFCLS